MTPTFVVVVNVLLKFAAKHIKANFIASEPSVKRDVTSGMVLYRNQWP